MKLWAIEFRPRNSHAWVNHHTVRPTRREAWQAVIDLDTTDAWWEEVHRRRDAGELKAVKVRIVKETEA